MKLVFLGPPGAGKGTQADLICRQFDLAHISTGDMLRKNMSEGTPVGVKARKYIEAGDLVPDDVIIDMVQSRIVEPDCKKGFLLDGFPRTTAQADALANISNIDIVINIDVPTDILVDRISGRRVCRGCGTAFHTSTYSGAVCDKCGGELYVRDDDKPETVLNRISVYNAKTQPLIDYYDERGTLITVDGNRSPDEVNRSVRTLLENL